MRILFAGSPAIAVPTLKMLCNKKGVELISVLTNPDSPKGRHGASQPTEAGEAAAEAVIPTLKPVKLDAPLREQVSRLKPDLLVSFAYGRIFGPKFLALFPLGGVNIHPSLLPKYRGPSPVQAAILNRDTVTGITIQTLAPEMDSGDILSQKQLQLTGGETAESLSGTIAITASVMLNDLLQSIEDGTVTRTPQNHSEASYCSVFSKEDGLINWQDSAAQIEARIRAFNPWPLCRTYHKEKELIILKATPFREDHEKKESVLQAGKVLGIDKNNGILIQTGNGILCVSELQYQGKKALMWKDFLNGARDFDGSQLG
ncbi:MAG: methionyl-tRNA formyltransferase [Treponema sp.]|nr:methionyl-tRNA formyltransferase [Treponema sp.]